jgi:glycosyltransferase involved in cell wall biosynthesis
LTAGPARLRLGYACAWWHPREQTWSYSAARLREALEPLAAVADIEAQRSFAGKALLRAVYWPRPGTPWKYSRLERRLLDRAVRRGVSEVRPDAVLAIGEVDTPTAAPTFVYQDSNAAVVLAHQAATGLDESNLLRASRELLAEWAAEQAERARDATGVFAMSHWYADFLVDRHGVGRDRVVVAPPGINNPPTATRNPSQPAAGRVLFVGTDFATKGGDLVVEAVRRLNAGGDREVRLTVIGPAGWPLAGPPPPFVDFRGRVPAAVVRAVYAQHDVLAMPSRFEGFGIALAEALVAGLPCVARRAFAMPEIVDEGVTGALVGSDDPDELAGALDAVLADAGVFARVAAARPALLERYDWRTTASAMVDRIEATVGGAVAGGA